MIEWTEIKDWKFEDGQACVICYKMNGKPWFAFINSEKAVSRYNRDGKIVTHITALNLPVEKTIDDKFIDYYEKLKQRGPFLTSDLVDGLVKIAKQHYEGEK